MARGPILLFGLPRSGTTWLGKIFDSHPDTLYKHEPESAESLGAIPLVPPVSETETYREAVRRYVERIPAMTGPRVSAKLPLFPKSYLSGPRFALVRLSAMVAKGGSRFFSGLPVVGLPRSIGPDGPRLVWKSIASLGRLGVIATATDGAAVHLIRHPCGFVSSILRGEAQQRFTKDRGRSVSRGFVEPTLATASARNWGLTKEGLSRLDPIEQMAWHWAAVNAKAMEESPGLGSYHLIRYEDLCADPLGAGRRLFDFAGLTWQQQTEAFVRQSVAHDNPAYYSVYKDPQVAANRWRKELDPGDAARIMRAVAETPPGRLYAE